MAGKGSNEFPGDSLQAEPARVTMGGVLHRESFLAEPGPQVIHDVRLVLDDQNPCVHTYIFGSVFFPRGAQGCWPIARLSRNWARL
jgi:hypothetical protein